MIRFSFQDISKKNSDAQQQQGEMDKNALDLFSRVQHAEFTCDNNELRHLLRDVRKEVLMLNKLVFIFLFFRICSRKCYQKMIYLITEN